MLVGIAVAVCLAPVVWQLLTALTPTARLYRVPPAWLPTEPTLDHFGAVFTGRPFGRNILNSAVVASGAAGLALLLGGLGAYAAGALRLRGGRILLGAALGAAMLPPVSVLTPLFTILDRLGWLNTYPALILPHAALTLPLTLWILTAYFRGIPREMREAAEVDGCSPLGALWRVILPAAAPGFATAGILAFIYSWNEFLFALSLGGTGRVQTVTVAIALFPGLEEFPWGEIAAASIVVTVPLVAVVLLLQRRIVEGLTAGAIGG
jgi:ABC-type glycerol-3-phosphate transport system permease component